MGDKKLQSVQVLLFSVIREQAGIDSTTLQLDPGEAVSAGLLLERLAATYPAIRPMLPLVRIAVNREYVPREHMVQAGDEVALITPVSGG